jgi:hypothetical protein
MLGKLLGLVTAGVFVGAAVVEVLGYLTRRRTAGCRSRGARETGAPKAPQQKQTAARAEG